tara:strand:- start:5645 stop:5926 length:282 start_codon:yes stop_codon:yes gene_type:complete
MKSIKASFVTGSREKLIGQTEEFISTPTSQSKLALNSEDIVFATDFLEFFYKDSDSPVEEGDPIGFEMDIGKEVELVLFDNIYWNPQYDEYEV